MIERKGKRASDVENVEEDSEETTFSVEPTHIEVGAGYTVAISHDEHEREVIDVKTYGQVDMSLLRKEIQRVFPDAEIRKLDQADSVAVVRTGKRKSKKRKK
jgi:hypothetical protein